MAEEQVAPAPEHKVLDDAPPPQEAGESVELPAVEVSQEEKADASSEAEKVEASQEEKVLEIPEEKTVEVAEERKVEEGVARESHAEESRDLSVPDKSFKEESYRVGDLKESEKKALEEFKIKVEEAIKNRAFEKPSPKPVREVEIPISADVEAVKEEDTKGEGVKADAKPEEPAAGTESSAEVPQPSGEEANAEAPLEAIPPAAQEVSAPAPPSSEPVKKEASAPIPIEPVVTETKSEGSSVEASTEAPVEVGGEAVVLEKTSREVPIEEEEKAAPLENYLLWGVPLLHTEGDKRTDVILLKFLRARDYKVNDAFEMLRNTVSWRKEFSADSLVEEDLGRDFDTVAYVHGYDKDGHPVCYNDYALFQDKEIYNRTFGDESKEYKFLRWRIQVVEKSIKKLNFNPGGVHSLVQVTDLKHSPGFIKWRSITNKALTLLQDNYPELVAKQIFINVPWYFSALYSIYGSLITQRQKSKVIIARPGKVTDVLFKYISPEHVPVKYGGFSRSNDNEFEGADASVTQVIVKAGEKKTVELPGEEHGAVVIWDLVVVGWDVEYGEEFVPNAESGYTVIVRKPKRLAASEEPIRNSFRVTEPGKIVLTIDGRASKRKRSVYYRHLVKKPSSVESY